MISFFQQTNSNKAAQKLKKLITNKIDVIRDELPNTVDVEDIVPGDIFKTFFWRHDSGRCEISRNQGFVY